MQPTHEDAVVFNAVTKRYRLGVFGGDLRDEVKRWFARVRDSQEGRKRSSVLALNDISFRVRQGENVALVGSNGAGKSTVLKLISRITRPTHGELWVRGRVAALIQLGAGFHRELTGRENVFLYGAILGMPRDEVAGRYDEIVEFAGLDSFMETPVKRYSNGMKVRLAFSVAVHVDPDVLLIDEVLAVGDEAFREKCLDRMSQYLHGKTTLLFVSHDRELVEAVCDRAILLDGGAIVSDGPVSEVLNRYQAKILEQGTYEPHASPRAGEMPAVAIERVELRDSAGRVETHYAEGNRLRVRIRFCVHDDAQAVAFGVRIQRGMTLVYESTSNDTADHQPMRAGRVGWAELELDQLNLLTGQYTVSAWSEVGELGRTIRADSADRCLHFKVTTAPARGIGLVSLGPRWSIDDVESA